MQKKHTIALCLILRKEDRHLLPCLQSAQPAFDALYVTDAGASPSALKTARKFSAKIRSFKWQNNWAEARNHSLANVSEDWLLILHPEEVFKEGHAQKLRSLLPTIRAQALTLECETVEGYTPAFPLRLFRNQPGLSFAGRIHEKLIAPPRLRRGNLSIRIVREGYTSSDYQAELKANLALLRKELLRVQKTEDSLQFWVLARYCGLAWILNNLGKRASSLWRKMLGGLSTAPVTGHIEQLTVELSLLAAANWWLLARGRILDAVNLCQKFDRRFGKFMAFQIIYGFTLVRAKQYAEGLKRLQPLVRLTEKQLPEIPFPASHLTVDLWNSLGLASMNQQRYNQALKYFDQCLEQTPDNTEFKANRRLAELLKQNFGS
jgi:tetratricopeptide (TPR) repeat protein